MYLCSRPSGMATLFFSGKIEGGHKVFFSVALVLSKKLIYIFENFKLRI